MKINAIIEKGVDGLYSIYSDQKISKHCFGGFGESVEIAKKDFEESIEEAKAMTLEECGTLPEQAKNITVEYKYDIPSFFNYFDCINVSKFAKMANINESKMRQYKCGKAFAGEKTTNKILKEVKRIGEELSTATL
ncbi:MAG: pilus assembly protein HicB [Bacteroidales bacterium]|jgi:hypothetical protein|nr:pilus assembly protein HicB [Bacteroidales bacterium]MCI2121846.1 pilus assembly protein HicB [Bacteroidales bacterium]MCI2146032.1 pilus assembly protein HicB [Bacteroidales bacterium]